ncbi:MAG: acetyl-CoA carboxylase biotin carboxyl carrier protein subunit [Cyclobacteriaceae bacterium]
MMENNENHQPVSFIIDDTAYQTSLTDKFKRRRKYEPENLKLIKAFIPGVIKNINVRIGQHVKEGDILITLEAMKMENKLLSPLNGTVKEILVEKEQMVPKNQLLIELE